MTLRYPTLRLELNLSDWMDRRLLRAVLTGLERRFFDFRPTPRIGSTLPGIVAALGAVMLLGPVPALPLAVTGSLYAAADRVLPRRGKRGKVTGPCRYGLKRAAVAVCCWSLLSILPMTACPWLYPLEMATSVVLAVPAALALAWTRGLGDRFLIAWSWYEPSGPSIKTALGIVTFAMTAWMVAAVKGPLAALSAVTVVSVPIIVREALST